MTENKQKNNDKILLGRECKLVFHLPAIPDVRNDTHIIKERLHYSDGSQESNLRILQDYKRPFWITKPHYQKQHTTKKESESLDKLNQYFSTESDLGKNVAIRLGGKYIGKKTLREVRTSPYVYGIDISSKVLIKAAYKDKYPDLVSPYTVATLDIETDVDTAEITINSIAMKDKIFTAVTKKFLEEVGVFELDARLNYLFDKYIPNEEMVANMKREYIVVDHEWEAVTKVIAKAHEWQPDFVAVWNMNFDINYMIDVLEKYKIDPKDVFSDPRLPKEMRSFKYIEGQKVKVTESGKSKPCSPEERWHVVDAPAGFYWIDAMAAHRYVRVGGKTVPGGYSLNNILNMELGNRFKKLDFKTDTNLIVDGIQWHRYMAKKHPLEYIIYNQWDILSMLTLDQKTKDLSVNVAALSEYAPFEIFHSGPKRIMSNIHFTYLENGKVIGSKPTSYDNDKILGLGEWIVLLPSHRVKEIRGLCVLRHNPNLHTNVRGFASDADQVAGYPTNGQALNVSKETTVKEVISIEGIPKEDFKLQNINLLFGPVNSIEYMTVMYGAPTLDELGQLYEKKHKVKR